MFPASRVEFPRPSIASAHSADTKSNMQQAGKFSQRKVYMYTTLQSKCSYLNPNPS